LSFDKRKISALFDRWAADPSLQPDRGDVPFIAGLAALDALAPCPLDHILDLGSGVGRLSLACARSGAQVLGVDLSPVSIRKARERAESEGLDNAEFRTGSFADGDFIGCLPDDSFDKVLLVYSLHHLPDNGKKRTLSAIAKMVKRPARIVISDLMFFSDSMVIDCKTADDACYDSGDTDFPTFAADMIEWLRELGATIRIERLHPMVGLIVADFA